MLVDDAHEFNFLHNIIIQHAKAASQVLEMLSADDALNYLASAPEAGNTLPDLILLDLNMPGKSGWDFLDEFEQMKAILAKKPVIIMLSSSSNPDDVVKARSYAAVSDYLSKPLTTKGLEDIIARFF